MEPWVKRVTDEKAELDGRIERLHSFIESEKFKTLHPLQRDLMHRQLGYMRAYSSTLRQRLECIVSIE